MNVSFKSRVDLISYKRMFQTIRVDIFVYDGEMHHIHSSISRQNIHSTIHNREFISFHMTEKSLEFKWFDDNFTFPVRFRSKQFKKYFPIFLEWNLNQNKWKATAFSLQTRVKISTQNRKSECFTQV